MKQSGPSLVVSNIGQNIYSRGSRGNIYSVAVRTDGKLQLFWRAGNSTSWAAGDIFGSGVGDTHPVMIQDFFHTANETSHGGFQLVVAVDGAVQHWQRTNDGAAVGQGVSTGAGKWETVQVIGKDVKDVWGLVQGSFGQNMHMVTEGVDGRFSYWEWDGVWKLIETLASLDDLGWKLTGEVGGG